MLTSAEGSKNWLLHATLQERYTISFKKETFSEKIISLWEFAIPGLNPLNHLKDQA